MGDGRIGMEPFTVDVLEALLGKSSRQIKALFDLKSVNDLVDYKTVRKHVYSLGNPVLESRFREVSQVKYGDTEKKED